MKLIELASTQKKINKIFFKNKKIILIYTYINNIDDIKYYYFVIPKRYNSLYLHNKCKMDIKYIGDSLFSSDKQLFIDWLKKQPEIEEIKIEEW